MKKVRILFTVLVSLAVIISASLSFSAGGFGSGSSVTVYVAPTLYSLAEEAASVSGLNVDLRSYGSVQALRLIESGKVPDAYLSVDVELARFIEPRRFAVLGSYRLLLVCREGYGLKELGSARIGIADPNSAPAGYRSLAALYWLATRYEKLDLKELEDALSVFFTESSGKVLIDARAFSASSRFVARDNLAGVGALLESGAVDCAFVHEPFAYSRNYAERFNVMELPEEISFSSELPVEFAVRLEIGTVKLFKFTAFAASFTEAGDRYVAALEKLDLGKYHIIGVDAGSGS